MSKVIRVESFPERNGPQVAGVISRYTGMFGVDELLENLPAQFEVEPETFEDLMSQLEHLGCNLAEPTPTEPAPPAEPTPEEHLLRLFIGEKADSYLRNPRANMGVYFVVVFFPIAWFFYRKLYLMGAGVTFGLILLAPVIAVVEESTGFQFFELFIALLLAGYATPLYMWHARRKVRDILKRDLSPEEREALARKTGGTSVLGAVLGILIMVALVALAIMSMRG
ncbi:MAG: DUF2628 domain-containing protein [Candidatus Methylomirabilales bacterium]